MQIEFNETAAISYLQGSPHASPLPAHSDRPWCFDVQWADSEEDVRDAQRLRYQVFVDEMGARLTPAAGTAAGLDADRFDPFCDHLLIRAPKRDDEARGLLIGTYRVLGPLAAQRAGGFYTDTEFDLAPLSTLRSQAVELGRACVHPAWRTGGVIMMLWSALGQYMLAHDLRTMIGCASISIDDGGDGARALWRRLCHTHLAKSEWQVRPRMALILEYEHDVATGTGRTIADAPVEVPPLIKGYLRCGARVLGPPAFDAAFNTADLPMMMRIDDLPARHRKHFLGT